MHFMHDMIPLRVSRGLCLFLAAVLSGCSHGGFSGHAAAAAPSGATARTTRSIQLHLDAPPEKVFPLFGPIREADWAAGWSPKMIYPTDASQSAEGAVFITEDPHGTATWVMTTYDAARGEIAYVNMLPGIRVTELRIGVTAAESGKSVALVTYRVTSLSEAGNAYVAHFAEKFPTEGPHWENAINGFLHTGHALPSPHK
jgi:hypothetical protein